MTADGCDKVTRHLDLCDLFHIPVLNLIDNPGFCVGLEHERNGTIRKGATWMVAMAQVKVPIFTVIMRRSFGVAGNYQASPTRQPNVRVSWPAADVGGIPPEGGIEAAYKRQLAEAADPVALRAELNARIESVRGPIGPLNRFQMEELVDPRDTRRLICEWIPTATKVATAPLRRAPAPRATGRSECPRRCGRGTLLLARRACSSWCRRRCSRLFEQPRRQPEPRGAPSVGDRAGRERPATTTTARPARRRRRGVDVAPTPSTTTGSPAHRAGGRRHRRGVETAAAVRPDRPVRRGRAPRRRHVRRVVRLAGRIDGRPRRRAPPSPSSTSRTTPRSAPARSRPAAGRTWPAGGGQWNCSFDFAVTLTAPHAEFRIKVGALAPVARPAGRHRARDLHRLRQHRRQHRR